MHELAVTQSMLNLALEYAERASAQRITRINLVVGEIAGIVDESVQFYFDFISQGTPAEGALLSFRKLPARFRCTACGQEFPLRDGDWTCPACQRLGGEVISGREFYMESIEVE
ncbi:MAG: hydrogenase maturation nickel metallochaperone HypA [Anaerolineae bacterium]|nr:hydrogenase maturation nickel metallochaperone HypA [Anaerolineae bacterium]